MRLSTLSISSLIGFSNGFTPTKSATTARAKVPPSSSPSWCLMGSCGRMERSVFGRRRYSGDRRLASASEDDILDSIVNGEYSFDDDGDDAASKDRAEEMDPEEIYKYFEGPEDEETKLELLEFVLEQHKPLGCTAEESVAFEKLETATRKGSFHHVFVAKVVEGGNAEKAGLKAGDVIVGLSGTFDEVMDVIGAGLDKVRSLVAGREEEKSLAIRVVRNSNVMSQHETALVDLCTLDGTSQSELNDCLNTIISNEFIDTNSVSEIEEENCDSELDDAECMLETMFECWVDEMPEMRSAEDEKDKEEDKVEKKKVAPWSSRSSPSGTYVRDPATGKMRNIDAQ